VVENNMSYIDLRYRPTRNDLVVLFGIHPAPGVSVERAAENVAGESSIGTWTEVGTARDITPGLAPHIFRIEGNLAWFAYPQELFEPGNMPQVLSSIAGNVFGMQELDGLRLHDVTFSDSLTESFPGPSLGVPGVRKLLKVEERPLVGTIVKPKVGLPTPAHAAVVYESLAGGCDIVKDDENLTSQGFNPFEERVSQTLEAVDRARDETGEEKAYLPNVTANIDEMVQRAELVKDMGGTYVMIDVLTAGFAAVARLRALDLGMVIHAHRAMHAAMTRNPHHGISMLALAKFLRLLGVDQLHIGAVVGKMEGGQGEVETIHHAVNDDDFPGDDANNALPQHWKGRLPVFSVASGGLNPLHVPSLLEIFGNDVIMQFGGGIHGHPQGSRAGATAARQALELAAEGTPLLKGAGNRPELSAALDLWGN